MWSTQTLNQFIITDHNSELVSEGKTCMKILTFDLPHAVGVMADTDDCQHNKGSKNSGAGPEQLILQPAGLQLQSRQCGPFYNWWQDSTAAMFALHWMSVCVRERESSWSHPSQYPSSCSQIGDTVKLVLLLVSCCSHAVWSDVF